MYLEIPANTAGEFTIAVSPGKTLSIGVDNPGGATFYPIGYLHKSGEYSSRTKFRLAADTTDTQWLDSTNNGMIDVGIQVTVVDAVQGITLEILECNL